MSPRGGPWQPAWQPVTQGWARHRYLHKAGLACGATWCPGASAAPWPLTGLGLLPARVCPCSHEKLALLAANCSGVRGEGKRKVCERAVKFNMNLVVRAGPHAAACLPAGATPPLPPQPAGPPATGTQLSHGPASLTNPPLCATLPSGAPRGAHYPCGCGNTGGVCQAGPPATSRPAGEHSRGSSVRGCGERLSGGRGC